jgi:diadenosine tetraphosphatase ApaH/serine/threonine PP2A family protein phosphatase
LNVSLSSIVKASQSVQANAFVRLIENVTELLCRENGVKGHFSVSGRLVKLEPVGEALVIGDLHGDLNSLIAILGKSGIIDKMEQKKDAALVFLGDYGDRGAQSTELYYTVLRLKLAFPEQIFLLRGNHEGPTDLLASPHDLPIQLQLRFKEDWVVAYSKIRLLFACLYNAVIVDERYLMVHGGLPSKIRDIQEIARADTLHPKKSYLEDLLWSDPDEEVQGTFPSPRGVGNLFGKAITKEVLGKLGVKLLIRGHEPCPGGFKVNHDGAVLTLFSRKGPPYFNKHGAYLQLPLSEKFENANQLLSCIHQF